MTARLDWPSRLAGLRCPDCGACQPLYTGAGKATWQRGPGDVVPCPGCGQPLRLGVDPVDPNGLVAGIVMTVGLTALLLGVAVGAARSDVSEARMALWVAAIVAAAVALAFVYAGLAARRRPVLRAETDPAREPAP